MMIASIRRWFVGLGLIAAGLLIAIPARAAWPERTITIIAQYAPGGSNDILCRVLAIELAPVLGQSVVVENRPGAGGSIGVTALARAAPDGYTFAVLSGASLMNPNLFKKGSTFDPTRDVIPVAYLGGSPNVLLTSPNSGLVSIQDLIAKAKANPGKINFATPGAGSVSHLSVEFLKVRTGINIVHVPFSGAAPAAQAAMAGTTELASVNISGMLGNVQSGALRALVQTGKERWPEMPNVPTLIEAGIPDAVLETTQFLLAPGNTPKPIVERVAKEVLAALAKREVHDRMMTVSFAVSGEGPEKTRERIARELVLWKTLTEQAGLRTD
jgi:tripartite-type tricarboxylate transporter receptor subunit TctC